MSFANYKQNKITIENENSINNANLEVPKALIGVWQSVMVNKNNYETQEIEALEAWVKDELDHAWCTKTKLKFNRLLREVEIQDGPVKILIQDLANLKDLNRAIG